MGIDGLIDKLFDSLNGILLLDWDSSPNVARCLHHYRGAAGPLMQCPCAFVHGAGDNSQTLFGRGTPRDLRRVLPLNVRSRDRAHIDESRNARETSGLEVSSSVSINTQAGEVEGESAHIPPNYPAMNTTKWN